MVRLQAAIFTRSDLESFAGSIKHCVGCLTTSRVDFESFILLYLLFVLQKLGTFEQTFVQNVPRTIHPTDAIHPTDIPPDHHPTDRPIHPTDRPSTPLTIPPSLSVCGVVVCH
ncbi:hypothetical protein QZH41_007323 [Actinostola sp. cb2023]|nr:hypothetical protein QZH41_007323 [Actinostola sp. cb2023]